MGSIRTVTVLKTRSYALAVRIARLSRCLISMQGEDVLSKMLLRSGTAIGAVIREADHARTRTGFHYKLKLALREVNETYYWLTVLRDTDYLAQRQFERLEKTCNEISVLLVSAIGGQKSM